MRLVNVLALINGTLINEPFINSFGNIVFDAKAVKRGDLFIAFKENEIEDAIFNGAYGVIFEKPTQISDTEIAWIKVSNIEDAYKRLLRFKLIERKVVAYECDEITLSFASQIVTDTSFIVLNSNTKLTSKSLWNIEEKSSLLFCPTLFDSDLFTTTNKLPSVDISELEVLEETLFETSFIYDGKFYERQTISPLFVPNLRELLSLFKSLKVNHRIKKFTPIEHFEAIFTNKNLEIKEFGSSEKVFIFEKELSYIDKEMDFLQKNALWAKKVYILPLSYKRKYTKIDNAFFYKTKKELKSILKDITVHFTFIAGVDKSIMNKPLNSSTQLLFDL